jgi:hypothetical protein
MRLLFYVSGHGYGHARRTAAVLEHLIRTRPSMRVSVRTTAPSRIFTAVGVPPDQIASTSLDAGVVEKDAVHIDVPATLQRLRDLMSRRQELIAHELDALRPNPPNLIATDIPSLPGEIARRLGVPCVAVGNFTWDWIYEPYLADNQADRDLLRTIRDDYASMDAVLRQPLSHNMARFRRVIDIPVSAHRARLGRRELLNQFGFDAADPRPRILIGMRGGTAPHAVAAGCRSAPDVLFTTLQPFPPDAPPNLRHIPQADIDFSDFLATHDVCLSKFGYGVVCDAAAAGTRLLWPPRQGFREDDLFAAQAPRFLPCQQIPREDYAAGNWAQWIRRLLDAPPVTPPPLDGQEITIKALFDAAGVA